MTSSLGLRAAALLGLAAMLSAGCGQQTPTGAPDAGPKPFSEMPANAWTDKDLIPADSALVAGVNIAEIYATDSGKALLDGPALGEPVRELLGLPPSMFDRVLIVMPKETVAGIVADGFAPAPRTMMMTRPAFQPTAVMPPRLTAKAGPVPTARATPPPTFAARPTVAVAPNPPKDGIRYTVDAPPRYAMTTAYRPGTAARTAAPLPKGPITQTAVPSREQMLFVVSAKQPIDKILFLKGVFEERPRNAQYAGVSFYQAGWGDKAACFVNEKLVIVGPTWSVPKAMQRGQTKDQGPVAKSALEQLDAKKHFVVSAAPTLIPESALKQLPKAFAFLGTLREAGAAAATATIGDDTTLDLKLTFADATNAEAGERSVKFALNMVQSALAEAKGPSTEADKLLDKVRAAFKSPSIERAGGDVNAKVKMELGPDWVKIIEAIAKDH